MAVFKSEFVTADVIKAFKEAGFVETVYTGQDGALLMKTFKCDDLEGIKNSVVDGEVICSDSECVVELAENGIIQIYIPDDDYCEKYSIEEEGFNEVAKDAGVNLVLVGK